MRKLSLSAVFFGLATLSLGATSYAQQAGGAAAQQSFQYGANAQRFGIAVVDISFLFQQYPKFTASMESLKAEMKAADAALTEARDAIIKREQERDALKPGSEDFKRIDEQIAHDKAEFQIKTGTMRRDISDKEAKIYFDTYKDISNAIATYARSNQIGLVLRFVGDQVDPDQPKSIMRAVSQQILFQNNVDITPHIRDVLFAQSGQAQRPQQQAGRPAPRRQ